MIDFKKLLLSAIAAIFVVISWPQVQSTAQYWSLPPHMRIALGELHQRGMREHFNYYFNEDAPEGVKVNPRVMEYLSHQFGDEKDDIDWCAAFTMWCMDKAHVTSYYPHINWASCYYNLEKGSPPHVGDLVLLSFKSTDPATGKVEEGGHIAFFWGWDENGDAIILGGNQRCEVSFLHVSSSQIEGYIKVKYDHGWRAIQNWWSRTKWRNRKALPWLP